MSDHAPDSSAGPAAQPQLHRRLGILNATSINMSNMIGIGPFITAAPILATLGGPQALVSWLAGTVLALADGLVAAELGASLPGSGGSYVFLRDSFGAQRWGKLMAWLFIWQFLFSGTLEIASGTVGMVQYLTYLWTGIGASPWAMRFLAAGIAALVTFSLYRKIGDVAKLMLILWITALLTTGWVILTGLLKMDTKLAFDLPQGAFDMNLAFLIGLGNGTVLVIYNFLGYNQVCCLAGEVKRPERTIPYAVILSVLGVAVIDFLLCFSFIGVVPWREIVDPGTVANRAVASVFMSRAYGEWAAIVLTVLILFTAFASVFALMLGYSRIPYAAALDGAFFRWFGVLHKKNEFPHRSLLLIGGLSIAASFFGLIEIITAMILARVLAQFAAQIIGLLVLRKYRPDVPRPFRMWLYPLPALLALVGWLFVFVSPVFQPGGWKYMIYALGTLGSGLILYFVLAKKKRDWPYAK
jgi:amino acid transporter